MRCRAGVAAGYAQKAPLAGRLMDLAPRGACVCGWTLGPAGVKAGAPPLRRSICGKRISQNPLRSQRGIATHLDYANLVGVGDTTRILRFPNSLFSSIPGFRNIANVYTVGRFSSIPRIVWIPRVSHFCGTWRNSSTSAGPTNMARIIHTPSHRFGKTRT